MSRDQKIARISGIVESGKGKVGGRMLDGFDAAMIMTVYDNLSPSMQEYFASLPVTAMAATALRVIKADIMIDLMKGVK